MRVYKICKNAIVFGVLCFFGGFAALAEGAEEVGAAENTEKANSAKSSQIAKQFEAIKESDFTLDFYVSFFD